MRFLVNDIAASSGGALEVLKEFYAYVSTDREMSKHEWIFLLNSPFFPSSKNIRILVFPKTRFNWIKRLIIDNISINKICKQNKVDGIISLQNTVGAFTKLPQMVYMHQIIPFQKEKRFSFLRSDERLYAVYQYIIGYLIKQSVRKADLTIVQALWIKDVVMSATKIESDRIIVNPLTPNLEISQNPPSNDNKNNRFFYPAFECIYKNQNVIREACKILHKRGEKVCVELTIDTDDSTSGMIIPCGKIKHVEVMKKLRSSTLIFPSYIESIGLPLLEAQSCNSIILAADCRYARETLAGYPNAYFFNPFNAEELADLMQKVKNKEIIIISKSNVKVPKSDWRYVIDRFIDLIQKKNSSVCK